MFLIDKCQTLSMICFCGGQSVTNPSCGRQAAPTDFTKPRQTVQSPNRLYKAPKRLYKAPKHCTKPAQHMQNLNIVDKNQTYSTRVTFNKSNK